MKSVENKALPGDDLKAGDIRTELVNQIVSAAFGMPASKLMAKAINFIPRKRIEEITNRYQWDGQAPCANCFRESKETYGGKWWCVHCIGMARGLNRDGGLYPDEDG